DGRPGGVGRLGADGGGQAEAHGAESAAGEPGSRAVEVPVLSGPHLMLAVARGHNRLVELLAVADDLPEAVDGVLRHDGVVAVGVAKRLRFPPFLDLANPVAVAAAGCDG